MKIALIDPEGVQPGLNVGLAYLSAVLYHGGYEVKVIDLNNKRDHLLQRLNKIKRSDFIGFSIKSFTLHNAIKIASFIPKGKSTFITGGPHITLDGLNFLRNNGAFDIGVIGEGEETIVEIVEERPLSTIKGIVYRDSSGIHVTPPREFVKDLDSLPFPNYDFFDSIDGRIENYPLITSRGCPYPCAYCSVGKVGGKFWRARSPKNVVEELLYAKRKYKISRFEILDDNFTLDMRRAKEICQRLIDEKLKLKWSCPNGVRADRLDDELLGLMKESGCESISIGIETCIPEIFDKINKRETLEAIFDSIRLAKKNGLKVYGFFIIGLPGSTFSLDRKSLKYAEKLGLTGALWGLLVPYPGTSFWDLLIRDPDVKMLRPWYEGFHFGSKPYAIFETSNYTERERLKMFYLANLRFENYYIFISNKAPLYENIINLLRIIINNDPYRALKHLLKLVLRLGVNFAKSHLP
jgi:radical SAM superfamily enzyme YgiQ (UPF0313 family)